MFPRQYTTVWMDNHSIPKITLKYTIVGWIILALKVCVLILILQYLCNLWVSIALLVGFSTVNGSTWTKGLNPNFLVENFEINKYVESQSKNTLASNLLNRIGICHNIIRIFCLFVNTRSLCFSLNLLGDSLISVTFFNGSGQFEILRLKFPQLKQVLMFLWHSHTCQKFHDENDL